ncbi:hypothetical protein C2S51_033433 [Perilla frutescens var. frutescens]|nr:hypothetical protein C2S51_033433 [Perilla frutescens var. frutescens]
MESQQELNLPFGYKFNPTSVELLEDYLIPKLKGDELPSPYVMDLHVYDYEPPQLPFNVFKHARENESYFFTEDLRKNTVEESQIRTTPNGYWKVYKDDVPIHRGNEVIGFKTNLLFHDLHGNQTKFKMIEYRCRFPAITNTAKSYIVCRVKLMRG